MRLIKLDSGEYPVSVAEFHRRYPDEEFGNVVDYQEYGYALVNETARPDFGRLESVRELPPVLIDDAYFQAWEIYDIRVGMDAGQLAALLNILKLERKHTVENKYNLHIQQGFNFDFGQIEASFEDGSIGPAGVQTFQMRDLEDKTNWQLALAAANEAIAAGGGDFVLVELRMASNALVRCTANQAKTALLALLSWGQECLSKSWGLKGQIVAAVDIEALIAIDTAIGWPV